MGTPNTHTLTPSILSVKDGKQKDGEIRKVARKRKKKKKGTPCTQRGTKIRMMADIFLQKSYRKQWSF